MPKAKKIDKKVKKVAAKTTKTKNVAAEKKAKTAKAKAKNLKLKLKAQAKAEIEAKAKVEAKVKKAGRQPRWGNRSHQSNNPKASFVREQNHLIRYL